MTADVLLVEAEPGSLAPFDRCLCGLDVAVHHAGSMRQALDFVATHDTAFAVVELALADGDGLEVAHRIHTDGPSQHVPIFLIAPAAEAETVMFRAFEAGVTSILSPPFQRGMVAAKARLHLEAFASRQRVAEQTLALERSNQRFREFAHAAAHDLRAPLRAITNMMTWLLEEADERERTALGRQIVDRARRMDTMLVAMLQFAAADNPEPRGTVDLAAVVADVREVLGADLEAAGATVTCRPLPRLTGDEVQLHRLVQNIVTNSLKYRRPETPLMLTIDCNVTEGVAELSFTDNGQGFDPQFAEELFRPFRRLVTAAKIEGSGIGMATARRVAEAHRGTIRAIGRPGEGATFVVALPITAAETAAWRERCAPAGANATEGAAELTPATVATAGRRLLLVDDDDLDRLACTRNLAPHYDLVVAADPAQALTLLDDSIAVVLSDFDMPGHDGVWLLSRVARDRPTVRRLLMSGLPNDRCRASVATGIAEAVFEKPVSLTMLDAVVGPAGAEPSVGGTSSLGTSAAGS